MRNKLLFIFIICIVLFFSFGTVRGAVVVGQNQVFEVSDGIDNFFVNNQDIFDYYMTVADRNGNDRDGYRQIATLVKQYRDSFYNYYVEPRNFSYEDLSALGLDIGAATLRLGYVVYFYRITSGVNYDLTQYTVARGSIPGYTSDTDISYTAVKLKAQYCYYVYNYGNNSVLAYSSLTDMYCPTATLYYSHPVFYDYLQNINVQTSSNSDVVSAIQSQTSSLTASNSNTTRSINETATANSQAQVSAINQSAQVVSTSVDENTDRLLSTETDDPDSLGVDNGTTNSGIDTSSLFQSFYTAFTTRDTTVRYFTFTMPNGQNYRIQLIGNILENRLRALNFFEIYQLFYWVAFGTYVIFDFIRIFNYFKNGGFEYAFNTLSPKDDLVKTALK